MFHLSSILEILCPAGTLAVFDISVALTLCSVLFRVQDIV